MKSAFTNVEERFLPPPEHRPLFTFGAPWLHYAHTRKVLNAADELLLRSIRRGYGQRAAIVDAERGETWTYERLHAVVNRLANAFRALGVEPGDRIVMRLNDVPAACIVQLATWKLGALIVPTATAERARELEFILADTEPVLIVSDRNYLEDVDSSRTAAPSLRAVIAWPDAPSGDYLSFNGIIADQPEQASSHPTAPLDASGIYYTGGTTGQPKGCLHTHAAEVVLADLNNAARGVGERDVFLCHAPIGHAFGNGEKINFPLRAGACAIYAIRPDGERMWELANQYGATIMAGAATMYRLMLAATDKPLERYGKLRLRQAVSSGEILDATTYERWLQALGFPVRNTVGMTPMRRLFLESNLLGHKVAPGLSVGRPLPGYEFRLVDATSGTDIREPGQPGRLAVRGPSGITYWTNRHPGIRDRAQNDVRDGWNFLDDAYVLDEDGWLWFQTRLDDMIVTGGRQVAPSEVEEVLAKHPAVAEAAVVGAPDPIRGQAVTAFVVLRPPFQPSPALVEELQQFCKGQMALYKYPRRVEFLPHLPKDPVGKLQRRALRQMVAASPQPEGAAEAKSAAGDRMG